MKNRTRSQKPATPPLAPCDLLDRSADVKKHRIVNPILGFERSPVSRGPGGEPVRYQINLMNCNRVGLLMLRRFLRRIEPDIIGRPHRIRIVAESSEFRPLSGRKPRHHISMFHKLPNEKAERQPGKQP